MEWLYRLIGFVSLINNITSHFRYHFIPLNIIIMGSLAIPCCIALSFIYTALLDGRTPLPLTLADVLAARNHGRNYVTVEGVLHPEAAFTFSRNGLMRTDAPTLYVPFTEERGYEAIAVRMSAKQAHEISKKPVKVILTGTLKNPFDYTRAMLKHHGRVGNYHIHVLYQLNAGRKPTEPFAVIILAFFGIPLVLMLVNFCMRYLVFRPISEMHTSLISPGDSVNPIFTWATGNLTMGYLTRRLQNVPSRLAFMENGNPVIFSKIDAPGILYGVRFDQLTGYWCIIMQQHGIRRIEPGRYYYGIGASPALRVSFIDARTNSDSMVVLGFPSEAERLRAVYFLSNPAATYPDDQVSLC